MLVKKINGNWSPAENNALKVGDVIDITDPKSLIIQGMCVAVDANGRELSTYEIFGVLEGKEKTDFEQWLDLKKQKELQEQLVKESQDLKKEAEEVKAVEEVKTEVKVTKKGKK